MDSSTYERYLAVLGEENDHVEFWAHDTPGDRILGILLGYQRGGLTRSGSPFDVAILRDPRSNALIGIPLWRACLAGKFADLDPQVGGVLLIEYLGQAPTRGGAHYHNYKLIVADEHGQRLWLRPARHSAVSVVTDREPAESEAY